MGRLLQIVLVISFAVAGTVVTGQTSGDPSTRTSQVTYSESASYTPRVFPETKDKKQNDKKKKEPPSIPVTKMAGSPNMTIAVGVFANNANAKYSLDAADFKVLLDDNEVEVISVGQRNDPLNVILLVDTSPSGDVLLKKTKDLANRFVEKLGPDDKVMVYGFNHELKAYSTLTSNRTEIAKAIGRLRMGDGTSFYQAIAKISRNELTQAQGSPILVIMTDGVDTTSEDASYQTSLTDVERTSAIVFPVYFDTSEAALKAYSGVGMISGARGVVTGPPGTPIIIPGPPVLNPRGTLLADYELGRSYLTDLLRLSGGRPVRGDELEPGKMDSLDTLPSEVKARYYVTFRLPPGGKPGERHRIKVRINKPNLTVLAKGSYIDQ